MHYSWGMYCLIMVLNVALGALRFIKSKAKFIYRWLGLAQDYSTISQTRGEKSGNTNLAPINSHLHVLMLEGETMIHGDKSLQAGKIGDKIDF